MKSNYLKISIFFALFGILNTSCKKDSDPSLKVNKWVESKDRSDTIEFKKQNAMQKLTSYVIWVMNNKGAIEEVL